MRVALLTLPSVMSDAASLAFARTLGDRLALLGLSDPRRAAAGGAFGQLRRHLARSGPAILPYLALGFGLPGARRALARVAAQAGAPLLRVEDVNGPALHAALKDARAELIVTLHFDQILSAGTIAVAPRGGINLHPSLLPLHRGPIPAFWALAEGGGEGGVSVHRLVPRIDAGAVLAQRAVPLPAGISALDAARRLHLAGVPLLRDVVARLGAGDPHPMAAPEPLPYRPFPDAACLRAARRRGVRLTRPSDVALLFRDPPGG
jgi:folate-dependent phosphoribosylglycinamide formyltransferase PurN